ncbi:hypothetical protein Aab01nite_19750 [Paractinoplanes abujensis]|uniref:Uncharacterized membrane protein YidH (DUF202 family) n=1 Tax=Paractinoplanes abujensis TaxID=882441 RepID=A0A7W7CYT4_9ACTN|nr:DUF202 domain-containing protein [Actinoplanes abujensis]MBB4697141.1 uncharacterized membrane protein YidH (DUF202 family) [Actinoplanes abujensis]GID18385.1 hypothetical protein Aab01nite_19750 [Actinoplanes abujensis]
MTHPPPDLGASAERTRLAWRRTTLSAGVLVLLAARPAFGPGAGPGQWIAAALAGLGWSALVALAYRRARALRRHPPFPGRRSITAYALTTVALAVLAGVIVTL